MDSSLSGFFVWKIKIGGATQFPEIKKRKGKFLLPFPSLC